MKGAVNGELAELVRVLAPVDDAQMSVQILRLSAASRLPYLLRTVPPSITQEVFRHFHALIEWSAFPGESRHDPNVYRNQPCVGHEALHLAHLPIRESVPELISIDAIKDAAYIGYQALILGHVVASSALENLSSLLEQIPERPMKSALIDEMKTLATEAEKCDMEVVLGTLRAARAACEDPNAGGLRTPLVDEGAI